ncbi:hypothetical protein O77CONTIG1_02955 [Leptolyngbya sp. O-77]|nr:hypothetical protein O77CONTIG1_02955 [Leptolyngbya sp. O-77]
MMPGFVAIRKPLPLFPGGLRISTCPFPPFPQPCFSIPAPVPVDFPSEALNWMKGFGKPPVLASLVLVLFQIFPYGT